MEVDFTPEKRVVIEPTGKTDSTRIFSAGTVS